MCLKNKIVSIALGAVIALAGIFAIGNNIAQAEKLTATSTAGMNIEQMQQMIVKLQEQIAYIVQLLAKQKAICGNQVCETAKGETKNNCLADCKASPKCDNGRCEIGETPSTCPQDCFMGKNTSSCTNQCSSPDLKQCWGNGYQTCGNYDSDACLEWSTTNSCPSNQNCQNGNCVAICNANSYKSCYNGDVYWYDSCNVRGSLYDDCAINEICRSGACAVNSNLKANGAGCDSNSQCASGICKQGFPPGYSGFCAPPCTMCWPS